MEAINLGLEPFVWSLKIFQGATWYDEALWEAGQPSLPVDLTGCSARAQIRPALGSEIVLADFSTNDGKIELGGIAGTIRLKLEQEVTSSFDWDRGVWDLKIRFPTGQVVRLAHGFVTCSKEATRGVLL